MPSIVTHYLFSEDILNSASDKIQKKLQASHQLYNIFAQSFDNFFYYNFLSFKSGKKIRKLGIDAQRKYCQQYFKNIIEIIKEKKLQCNSDILAYLYGSITHYILDKNCHPFVIYHAGWCEEKNKQTKKYRGLHEKIEVGIDAIYYKEKTGKNLYQANLGSTLLPKQKLNEELKSLMDQVFKKTFKIANIGNIYEQSINQGHTIIKYFITDHYGIKKLSYALFDIIFQNSTRKYQNLSFHIKKLDKSILNRNHQQWCNPTDKSLTSTESFDDLYEKSIQEALEIFTIIYEVINNNLDLQVLLARLEDKSYVTGLDWKINRTFNYFDPSLNLVRKNHE